MIIKSKTRFIYKLQKRVMWGIEIHEPKPWLIFNVSRSICSVFVQHFSWVSALTRWTVAPIFSDKPRIMCTQQILQRQRQRQWRRQRQRHFGLVQPSAQQKDKKLNAGGLKMSQGPKWLSHRTTIKFVIHHFTICFWTSVWISRSYKKLKAPKNTLLYSWWQSNKKTDQK